MAKGATKKTFSFSDAEVAVDEVESHQTNIIFFTQCDCDIQTNQKKKGLHVGMLSWNAVMKNGTWFTVKENIATKYSDNSFESEESSIALKKKWFNWIVSVEPNALKNGNSRQLEENRLPHNLQARTQEQTDSITRPKHQTPQWC